MRACDLDEVREGRGRGAPATGGALTRLCVELLQFDNLRTRVLHLGQPRAQGLIKVRLVEQASQARAEVSAVAGLKQQPVHTRANTFGKRPDPRRDHRHTRGKRLADGKWLVLDPDRRHHKHIHALEHTREFARIERTVPFAAEGERARTHGVGEHTIRGVAEHQQLGGTLEPRERLEEDVHTLVLRHAAHVTDAQGRPGPFDRPRAREVARVNAVGQNDDAVLAQAARTQALGEELRGREDEVQPAVHRGAAAVEFGPAQGRFAPFVRVQPGALYVPGEHRGQSAALGRGQGFREGPLVVVAERGDRVEHRERQVAAGAHRRVAQCFAAREIRAQEREAVADRIVVVGRVNDGQSPFGGALGKTQSELHHVLQVDEFGPLHIEPRGKAVGKSGRVERLRGIRRCAQDVEPRDLVTVALLPPQRQVGQLGHGIGREHEHAVPARRECRREGRGVVLDAGAFVGREGVGH